MSEKRDWLIWSFEHSAWWGPKRGGYFTALYAAGLYTEAEAKQIERDANRGEICRMEEARHVSMVADTIKIGLDGFSRLRELTASGEAPWERGRATAFTVINLHEPETDCAICGELTRITHGVPRYEDEILSDYDEGEWGGTTVCLRCFYLVRGIQAQYPGKRIPFWYVKAFTVDEE